MCIPIQICMCLYVSFKLYVHNLYMLYTYVIYIYIYTQYICIHCLSSISVDPLSDSSDLGSKKDALPGRGI